MWKGKDALSSTLLVVVLIAVAGCNQQDMVKNFDGKPEYTTLSANSLRDLRNTGGEAAFNPFMPNSPMLPYSEGNEASSPPLFSLDSVDLSKLPTCNDAECSLPVDAFRFALNKEGLTKISPAFGEAYTSTGKVPQAALGVQWAALLGSSIFRAADAYALPEVAETSQSTLSQSTRFSVLKSSSYSELLKLDPAHLVDFANSFWTDFIPTLDESKRQLHLLRKMAARIGGEGRVAFVQGRQIKKKVLNTVTEEVTEMDENFEEWPLGEAVSFNGKEAVSRFSKEALKSFIQKDKSLIVINGAFVVTGYSDSGDIFNVFDPYSGQGCRVKIYRHTYTIKQEIELDRAPSNANYRSKCEWVTNERPDGSPANRRIRVCKYYVDFTRTVQGVYTLAAVLDGTENSTRGMSTHCPRLSGLEVEQYFAAKLDLSK